MEILEKMDFSKIYLTTSDFTVIFLLLICYSQLVLKRFYIETIILKHWCECSKRFWSFSIQNAFTTRFETVLSSNVKAIRFKTVLKHYRFWFHKDFC